MVFGNRGVRSGSGVGFTRNPASGEKGLYFDFLFNSQGEDIVSGRTLGSDTERLFAALPEIREELTAFCAVLEGEFGDAQEFECTIEEGVLYLLQSRSAKRTPWAALRITVEQVREGLIGRKEALARLEGIELGGIVRQMVVPDGQPAVGAGEPSGVGVAVGPLTLDIDRARAFAAGGRPAVLVREEMSTNDIAGIDLCAGVLTAKGNRTSHAAVVARQLGKACVTGCADLRIDASGQTISIGGETLAVGETVTLDANTGRLYRGEQKLVVEYPSEWLEEVRGWGR
jgi:pyruvate,orthophosphate dikinase